MCKREISFAVYVRPIDVSIKNISNRIKGYGQERIEIVRGCNGSTSNLIDFGA